MRNKTLEISRRIKLNKQNEKFLKLNFRICEIKEKIQVVIWSKKEQRRQIESDLKRLKTNQIAKRGLKTKVYAKLEHKY